MLTAGATSATRKSPISWARRLEIWLRSSATQKCVDVLAILHSHQVIVDKLLQVATDNDFVDNLPNR